MPTAKNFSFTNFYQNSVMVMEPSEVGLFASGMLFLCVDVVYGPKFIFSVIFYQFFFPFDVFLDLQ